MNCSRMQRMLACYIAPQKLTLCIRSSCLRLLWTKMVLHIKSMLSPIPTKYSPLPRLLQASAVDTVKAALEEMGYTCEYYAFSDSNDLATITTNAATNSDVIYVPTDNTVAANTEIVNNICQPAKVPVIAGEEGICSGCGVATLSISYYDLGVATGKMAVKILTGEANVSEMPIEYAPQFTKKYNKTICDALEITVPDDYVAIEE